MAAVMSILNKGVFTDCSCHHRVLLNKAGKNGETEVLILPRDILPPSSLPED